MTYIFLIQTTTFWRTLFFTSTTIESSNLDPGLRKSEGFLVFKIAILKFIHPSPNSVFNCHNPKETCLLQGVDLV